MLGSISFTEVLLILLVVALVGGVPAGIAIARRRSPIAWFFIGIFCTAVVGGVLAKTSLSPNLRVLVSIGVAPGILLCVARGRDAERT